MDCGSDNNEAIVVALSLKQRPEGIIDFYAIHP